MRAISDRPSERPVERAGPCIELAAGEVADVVQRPNGRTLVIADVHANVGALEAVLAIPHNAVICVGDVVGYGPDPAACVRRLRDERALVVQGNHDRATASGSSHRSSGVWRQLADATDSITRSQLDADDMAYLHGLPRWARTIVNGLTVTCIHATPRDLLYGRLGADRTRWNVAAALPRF